MADEFDAILKDINININTAVKKAAQEIGTKIQDEYEIAITNFYMAYSPILYERTYSLYEGAKGVGGYGKYQKQTSKNEYDCGINVGAENYSGNPYTTPYPHGLEMDPSIVFPNAWDKGRHGFSSYNVRIKNKDKVRDDPNYWKIKKKHVPQNSTPPKQTMNYAFKKIDNYDYCTGLILKYLAAAGGI